jgi:hypothetical protein
MTSIAALVFCTILFALALFQAALAAGAPLGRFAWGGRTARLPTQLRIGSLVAILIYAAFALIVLDRAGVVDVLPGESISHVGIWVVAGYLALGVIMNAVSRSAPERFTMTPIALALLGLSLVVALG